MEVRVIRDKNRKIVGYETYPKKEGEMMELNDVIKRMNEKTIDKETKEAAFKAYRTDLSYGIESESEEEHEEILKWYESLRSGENKEIPEKIKKYIEV